MEDKPPDGITSQLLKLSLIGHRTLVEAELSASVGWLIFLRWFACTGVVLVTWIVEPVFKLHTPQVPLTIIGASILFYNLIFYIINRHLIRTSSPSEYYRWLAMGQVGLDWVAMTLLIHFSGGIESPAIFFFIFHIVIASIFFQPRAAFAFTFLAILLLSVTTILEYFSIFPHEGINGFLQTPLYQNGLYVAAVLVFFSSTALIVAYLGTAINERLRRREEEVVTLTGSLQRATTRLQALNDGARTISSTLELSQVLNRLVENTAQVMEVRACSIRLLDKSGRRLEPVAVYGLSQAYLDKGPVELENNPLAREVLGGKIVNVPDVTQTSLLQYPEWAVLEGINAMLSAPLIGKSGPLGILRAYSDEQNHFTSDDEAFLSAIAAQGSIAIENAIAYQAIEALDSTKSTFIRMVTHELRSPVSVTRSLLRTITAGYTGDLNAQQREILERAVRRIDYLQKLIDDLLDVATGKVDIKSQVVPEPVALNEVVLRVIKRFEVPAREKEVTIEWCNETGTVPTIVMATAEEMDRVFNNLISNAVKYTLPKGKVTVTLTQVEREAWVGVIDTGIGIPEDALGHLFEEFYRAPNAKELEREGTGLGLVIVKDLVTRFGGRITVQSTLGVGTWFTVVLPLAENPAVEPDEQTMGQKAAF